MDGGRSYREDVIGESYHTVQSRCPYINAPNKMYDIEILANAINKEAK